jgi:hypothetical protein
MIETNTAWSETAYDCVHCGGIIMKRIDQETGQADRVCHQCGQCGCQWSLTGELLRMGHSPECRAFKQQAENNEWAEILGKLPQWPRNPWVYVGLALIVFLLFARLGLIALLIRVSLPLLVIALIVWLIWQSIKQSRKAV